MTEQQEAAMRMALEALEKLWDIIDDIDTYGDMAKADDKLYRSLVERRQRQRFEETGISTDGYELNGGAITALRRALEQTEPLRLQCTTCGTVYANGVPPQVQQPAAKVSPLEFVTMVLEKEHLVGKPLIWAEWPNKESNDAA